MKFLLKNRIKTVLFFLFISLTFLSTACQKESPTEKAKKEVEKILDGAKEKLKDLTQ